MATRKKQIEKKKLDLQIEVQEDAQEFRNKVQNLDLTIKEFSEYSEVKIYYEISKIADNINTRIKEYIQLARKIN